MSIQEILDPSSWLSTSGGPRYVQLHRRLEKAIQTGQLPPGSPLPPEREIALMTTLSRVTVRKAVQPLVADGLVVQRRMNLSLSMVDVPEGFWVRVREELLVQLRGAIDGTAD